MHIVLLSDIHGNQHALPSCLGKARAQGAERCDFPGALSAFSTDPPGVIAVTAEHAANGITRLRGMHDQARRFRGPGLPEAFEHRVACGR